MSAQVSESRVLHGMQGRCHSNEVLEGGGRAPGEELAPCVMHLYGLLQLLTEQPLRVDALLAPRSHDPQRRHHEPLDLLLGSFIVL